MATLIELIDQTAPKLNELESKAEAAEQAFGKLSGEIESLTGDLTSDFNSLIERSNKLVEKAGSADQELRESTEKVTQTISGLTERTNTKQEEVDTLAGKAQSTIQEMMQRFEEFSTTAKENFDKADQKIQEVTPELKSMEDKLTSSRSECQGFLGGAMSSALGQARETTEKGSQGMAEVVNSSVIPTLSEKGQEFNGWLAEAGSQVTEQFNNNIEQANSSVRDVMDGLTGNLGSTVDQLTGAVEEVDQLMDTICDFLGGSAQTMTTVMEGMSTVSETAAIGITSVTDILDDLQSIFRNLGD